MCLMRESCSGVTHRVFLFGCGICRADKLVIHITATIGHSGSESHRVDQKGVSGLAERLSCVSGAFQCLVVIDYRSRSRAAVHADKTDPIAMEFPAPMPVRAERLIVERHALALENERRGGAGFHWARASMASRDVSNWARMPGAENSLEEPVVGTISSLRLGRFPLP